MRFLLLALLSMFMARPVSAEPHGYVFAGMSAGTGKPKASNILPPTVGTAIVGHGVRLVEVPVPGGKLVKKLAVGTKLRVSEVVVKSAAPGDKHAVWLMVEILP